MINTVQQLVLLLVKRTRVSTQVISLNPNFVEISMFRFWCRNRNFDFSFGFDCLLSTKSKFRLNSILISSKFRCRNQNSYLGFYVEIEISFGLDFDIRIPILISISESEFRFRHRNSDFFTRFQYQCRSFKASFTEISQNLYFDFVSEFRFRPSKSKFRLLSIISTQ
jgi:hypothetical protein